jgi:hypothetical protein
MFNCRFTYQACHHATRIGLAAIFLLSYFSSIEVAMLLDICG